MSEFPIYYIEWIDACSLKDSGWKGEQELDEFCEEKWLIKEVGFVIKETKDYVCLVGGYNANLTDHEFTGHRDLKIPTHCILKKVKLKLLSKRKPR